MEIIKIKDVISELELLAPGNYQESYDNSGLLTGDASWNVNGISDNIGLYRSCR